MIGLGFLAPVLLKMSPVGKFLKAIPWQVWVGIAVAIALIWHLRSDRAEVREAFKKGDAAGYARANKEIEVRLNAMRVKADALVIKIRSKNDENARAVAAAADDLRVRGPGAARCPGFVPPRSAGRPSAPRGARDAPAAPVPADDRAAVPWGWVVGQAERCDLNRNEVLSWREWYKKLKPNP